MTITVRVKTNPLPRHLQPVPILSLCFGYGVEEYLMVCYPLPNRRMFWRMFNGGTSAVYREASL